MNAPVMTTEEIRKARKPDDVEAGFGTYRGFQAMQHMAEMLANSSIVPEDFRKIIMVKDGYDSQTKKWNFKPEENPNAVSNCIVALNMSARLQADPMMIMQNLYLIEGRPSWSSQFIIAAINSSGRYSPLRFDITGVDDEVEIPYAVTEWKWNAASRKKEPVVDDRVAKVKNMVCVAWAVEHATGERLESSPISMDMAIKEGWYQKNGSKWQTMPEQMLRYRAASFFGRIYAPDLLMGLRSADEEQDRVIDVTPPKEDEVVASVEKTVESIRKTRAVPETQDEVAEEVLEQEPAIVKQESKPRRAVTASKAANSVVDVKQETTKAKQDSTPQEPVGLYDDEPVQATIEDNPDRVKKILDGIGNATSAATVSMMMRYTNGLSDKDLSTVKDAMTQRNRELTAPEKPSLKVRMEACNDSDELGVLSTEIEFLDPAIQPAMWTVYEQRNAELNA